MSNNELTIVIIFMFAHLLALSAVMIYTLCRMIKLTRDRETKKNGFEWETCGTGDMLCYFEEDIEPDSELGHAILNLPDIHSLNWVTKKIVHVNTWRCGREKKIVHQITRLMKMGLGKEKKWTSEREDSAA